jgi:hypothetical protein
MQAISLVGGVVSSVLVRRGGAARDLRAAAAAPDGMATQPARTAVLQEAATTETAE